MLPEKQQIIHARLNGPAPMSMMELALAIEERRKEDDHLFELFNGCNLPELVKKMVDVGYLEVEGSGLKMQRYHSVQLPDEIHDGNDTPKPETREFILVLLRDMGPLSTSTIIAEMEKHEVICSMDIYRVLQKLRREGKISGTMSMEVHGWLWSIAQEDPGQES